MLGNSKYRLVSKATWGIAINFSAEWDPVPSPPDEATQVVEGLWLVCDDKSLTSNEVFFILLGLKMVSDAIAKHKPDPRSVLIKVKQVDYNPTDYQPEGLVATAVQWAAEAFQFPKPEINGNYDNGRRRYVFSFEENGNIQDGFGSLSLSRPFPQ